MLDSHTTEFQKACGAEGRLGLRVEFPGSAGAVFRQWDAAHVLIGKSPRCDLCLQHEDISRRHAYLQMIGGRVFCVDLCSDSGTHWANGNEGCGWLDPQQAVGIGPFRIRLAAHGQTSLGDSTQIQLPNPLQMLPTGKNLFPSLVLDIQKGARQLAHWRMTQIVVLVGSSPRCKICLSGSGIKPFHGSLVRTPSGTWFVNFGGTTRLNDVAVHCARLEHGDLLQIGGFCLRASYDPAGSLCPTPEPALPPPSVPGLAPKSLAANGPVVRASRQQLVLRADSPTVRPQEMAEPESPAADWVNAIPVLQSMGKRADPSWTGFPQPFLLQVLTQQHLLQQMVTQNQEATTVLCRLVDTLVHDQRDAIREEIDRLQQTTQDLKSIQAQLANKTSVRLSAPLTKAAATPACHSGPPVPTGDQGPEAPARKALKELFPPHQALENPELSHGFLIERMAALQNEQQTRLRKVLKYLHGKIPGAANI